MSVVLPSSCGLAAAAAIFAVPRAAADPSRGPRRPGHPRHPARTGTLNIEIPVRVFKGDTFVDGVTIADFEVYEDGKLQTLDAVYLVKKTFVERKEENTAFVPDTGRHFYLYFELTEYDSQVREALDYFVREVLADGDELVVVTPLKTYRMKSDILRNAGREAVFEKLMGILRRDILVGNSEYQDILHEMTGLASTIASAVNINTSGDYDAGPRRPLRLLGFDLRAEDVDGGAAAALRRQPEPAREPEEPRPLPGQPAGQPSQGPDRAEGDLPLLPARVHPQDRPGGVDHPHERLQPAARRHRRRS